MTFIDSNVVLDLLYNEPAWADWSEKALLSIKGSARISPVVYAEITGGFPRQEDLDRELQSLGLSIADPSRNALFAAGRAHADYRRRGGPRHRVLPDFLIGAQAVDERALLVTRDPRRYRTAFPDLRLVTPP